MHVGLLILRLVVGGLFIGHGAQKLWGKFGGHGLQGTAQWLASLGYQPAELMAKAVGITEFTAGCLLVLGLATPLAGAMIIGVMVNAIMSVHLPNGLWVTNNGIEYPLVNATIGALLGFLGAGSYSFDRLLDLPLAGIYSGIWTLIVGVGSAAFVLMLRRRRPVEAPGIRERTAA